MQELAKQYQDAINKINIYNKDLKDIDELDIEELAEFLKELDHERKDNVILQLCAYIRNFKDQREATYNLQHLSKEKQELKEWLKETIKEISGQKYQGKTDVYDYGVYLLKQILEKLGEINK